MCERCGDLTLTAYLPALHVQYQACADNTYSVTGLSPACKHSEIVLPETYLGEPVTTIGDSAFLGCNDLVKIDFPATMTEIGERAFYGCMKLTDIQFKGTVEEWQAIEKGSEWDSYTGKYTVTCTNGTVTKDGTVTYFEEK